MLKNSRKRFRGRKRKATSALASSGKICLFCKRTEESDDLAGKLYSATNEKSNEEINVHYLCLLFACGLHQRDMADISFEGDTFDIDKASGICGFDVADVVKEGNRGSKLSCTFCKKPGATAACCLEKCKIKFHLPCGRHKTFQEYMGTFSSYCPEHYPFLGDSVESADLTDSDQQWLSAIAQRIEVTSAVCYADCGIKCGGKVLQSLVSYSVIPIHCCRQLYFHRDCIQKYAYTKGSLLCCLLCRNSDSFVKQLKARGIFVPDRDVDEELEQDYDKRRMCDAVQCICPDGRAKDDSGNEETSPWDLIVCNECGHYGTHVRCGETVGDIKVDDSFTEDQIDDFAWKCDVCLDKISNEQMKERSVQME